MTLTFGSLFAGIGGFDLGFERAGMMCKWQVEIDDFCNKVLEKHWPDVRRYRDVREVGKHNLEAVDVICGGFPCQDVSTSGYGKGISEGTRSGLWYQMQRICSEIKPRWIVVENVLGLLSNDNGRSMGIVLRDLAKIGYNAEWDCISAMLFGAPHRRSRIFIIANSISEIGIIPQSRQEQNNYSPLECALSRWKEMSMDIANGNEVLWDRWIFGEWGDKSKFRRVVYGIPSELDKCRVSALGNAVVPQVAEWIGRRIVEAEEQCSPAA